VPAEQAPEVLVFPVPQYEEPDSVQNGLLGDVPAITALITKTDPDIRIKSDKLIIMAFFIIF
jgi:hypothetical protein